MKISKILISVSILNEIQFINFKNFGLTSIENSLSKLKIKKINYSCDLFIYISDKNYQKKIKNNLTKFKVKFFNLNYYAFTDKELEIKNKIEFEKSKKIFNDKNYDLLINFLPEYYISENLLINLINLKNKGIKKFYSITPTIPTSNFKKEFKKKRITNNNLNKFFLNNIKQDVIINKKNEFIFNHGDVVILRSSNQNLIAISNSTSNSNYFITNIKQGLIFKLSIFSSIEKKFYLRNFSKLSYLKHKIDFDTTNNFNKLMSNFFVFYSNEIKSKKILAKNKIHLLNYKNSKKKNRSGVLKKIINLDNEFNISTYHIFEHTINKLKKNYNLFSLNFAILSYYALSNLPWNYRVFILRLILKKKRRNYKFNLNNFGSFFYNLNRKTLAYIILRYLKIY